MLKAPPLISMDLHFSEIKYHCRTYEDKNGPKLKKPSSVFWGHKTYLTISSTIMGRDSLTVSTLACHAADLGSNPAQGNDFFN